MICVSHVGGECVGCHLQESCSVGFTAVLPKIKSYSANTFFKKKNTLDLNCCVFLSLALGFRLSSQMYCV